MKKIKLLVLVFFTTQLIASSVLSSQASLPCFEEFAGDSQASSENQFNQKRIGRPGREDDLVISDVSKRGVNNTVASSSTGTSSIAEIDCSASPNSKYSRKNSMSGRNDRSNFGVYLDSVICRLCSDDNGGTLSKSNLVNSWLQHIEEPSES